MPALWQALTRWETWQQTWDQDYQAYRDLGKGDSPSTRAEHSWRQAMPRRLAELCTILNVPAILQTVRATMPSLRHLLLVPHRDLHRFPLHVLFGNDYTIRYLHTLHPQPHSPGLGSLLSVEHPDSTTEGNKGEGNKRLERLAFAAVESIAIRHLATRATALPDDQATRAAVLTALADGQHQIFHFTGHGAYNSDRPSQSMLALSGSDRLILADLLSLNLRHYQLVCLSSCETAITGNHSITSDYVGWVSGFLRSGAAQVVSTLWTVQSISSTLLMVYFYRRCQRGNDRAVALQQAQWWLQRVSVRHLRKLYDTVVATLPVDEDVVRPLLRDELRRLSKLPLDDRPYAHPYHWAAFTITGIDPGANP